MLYGVADYAQIRKKNAWFVDRTAKIRDLEATRGTPTGSMNSSREPTRRVRRHDDLFPLG